MKDYRYLSPEQVDLFLNHGYVVVKNAFDRERAAEFTDTMWIRLGLDPQDKSTWTKERIHMPYYRRVPVADFAPKAWYAIQDLLGGEERIADSDSTWGDNFIVNFGRSDLEGSEPISPKDLDNWHVDGDFFVHYLDSPEQALLVIPIFSDIKPSGGGTFIAPDGIGLVAQYLAKHSEGVLPTGFAFTPSNTTASPYSEDPEYFSHLEEVKKCQQFLEMTGEVGDVVLLHPLMLHSASENYLRVPRVITNPPVKLKEPFNFNRSRVEDYSLVERKTLKALGLECLDYQITTERRRLVPKREIDEVKASEEERARLAAAGKL
ncbi:hypothetical protein VNI00_001948 [Paramarasmius palmivorus]|uniref:Phytanoyl-CoA dioxygenase n=1 Tax=Paramarasmius palmivorus TaxID=297713 RepID=A0AAW0E6T9_9AGAR